MLPRVRRFRLGLFALGLGCGLSGGGSACASGSTAFRPMPFSANVFFRLECSLGSVRFVGISVPDSAEIPCPPSPEIVQLAVGYGEYRLAFRDPNEDRRWQEWHFRAAPGSGGFYWGDISILPGLARVERSESTIREIRKKSGLGIEIGVKESR